MSLLIFEGVTGSGKTSTIDALRSMCELTLIREERTFDDFMREFDRDPRAATCRAVQRLGDVLDEVAHRTLDNIVLERFHFSNIALGADPERFSEIEERLSRLGCKVVVFIVLESELARRSLYRSEYGGADWQGLLSWNGSEDAALRALQHAQNARLKAIESARLPYRELNTAAMEWERYAADVADFVDWPRKLVSG